MPIYNVFMGQGVSVPNLGANTLITGPGAAKDTIQSCAAVILFNTGSHAAGLFHFPAGNILTDGVSRANLISMSGAVVPDQAYIAYGVQGIGHVHNPVTATDPYATNLLSFVVGLLPFECRLRGMPAPTGIASISLAANGSATIGSTRPAVALTSLRAVAAGNYHAAGYRVYGTAR